MFLDKGGTCKCLQLKHTCQWLIEHLRKSSTSILFSTSKPHKVHINLDSAIVFNPTLFKMMRKYTKRNRQHYVH